MKLPTIKHINGFVKENDIDFVWEALALLEHMTESNAISDEEIDVLGELISNMYGAIEVNKLMKAGKTEKVALNTFMQRVMGSIDN